MKAPETTVTLPRIAVAIAAALAVTATVLAIPTFAQATTARTAAVAGIRLDRLTSPITAGAYATVAVRTSRPATCSISVYYKSGPSQAAGLYPKRGTRISLSLPRFR